MIPIAPGWLFWSYQILMPKKIQQRFKKVRLRILHFIRYMYQNSLKLKSHNFLTNILRPILFIIPTIKYNSLRMSENTSFQFYFIWWLVHIITAIFHQRRMVDIINSLLYVFYDKYEKINFFLWKEFWFKFSKQIITELNLPQFIRNIWNNCSEIDYWIIFMHV